MGFRSCRAGTPEARKSRAPRFRADLVPTPGKIDVPALDVSADELHTKPVADVGALLSSGQHSFNMRLQHPNKGAVLGDPGHGGVKGVAAAAAHGDGGDALRHLTLHLLRCI